MAFRPKYVKNIGTDAVEILNQIPTDGKTRTLIGLSISNTYGSGVLADIYITSNNGLADRADTDYVLGDLVIGTDTNSLTAVFECTTAGNTDAANPWTAEDFTTYTGRTTTTADGTAQWTFVGLTDFYIGKNVPISSGATEIVVGGDQKVVLYRDDTNGQDDRLFVKSNVINSIDVVASFLQED